MKPDTSWVDRTVYPFASNYIEIDGSLMHYVDSGQGAPIVFVHGTSAWSFIYRDIIKALSSEYRCIAPDHLGYGLSEKPEGISYQPADHAKRLRKFIEHLNLQDITLVVHDYGGPIGLSYAIEQSANVRRVILFNTWMWSLRGEFIAEFAGLSGKGWMGRLFIQQLNLEMHLLFRIVWGKRSRLTRSLYQQYLGPFQQPADRKSLRILARALIDSTDWYEGLWGRRENIKDIPALLLWGSKDPIFRKRHLQRWQALFTDSQLVIFQDAGHFVQEEGGERLLKVIQSFLKKRRTN